MTDTVVVTGALGGSGSWIVDRLREDHEVIAIDRELPEIRVEDVDFRAVDLTEQGPTWETIVDADPDSVVHFGNIPHEENHAGGDVYRNNVLSTFDVLEAAGRADARVVWASSETVYGTHWPEPELPASLPIDESHPTAPWNAYETSKLAGEAVAERIANAFGVQVATIRPSWIQYPGSYAVTAIREGFDLDSASRSGNLWSYVDVRDVVGIVEAALTTDFDGHEVFNAFAADTYLDVSTTEAIEAGYGDLPEECDLDDTESGFSTAKAGDLLGWEPEHSWREAETEDVDGPAFVRGRR
ncbi:NAD-dependent epimerase/dehydratase family protein [Halococcus agarilyticus]|uniref:NAD-dependent epimerase/dehydratase family protein n=1 Tax=Halococcus agarilyticus TaxID=1232219 RepID=UPI0006776B1E|nr:NAD(P)-dependent oxidoreductase [Halococcus agarilyticus]